MIEAVSMGGVSPTGLDSRGPGGPEPDGPATVRRRRTQSNTTTCRTPIPSRKPVEAFVDLLEPQPVGQQRVDRQLARLKERDQARHVAQRSGGADVGAFQRALFGDQGHRRERHALVGMRQARGDGHAAARGRGIGEFERRHRAGHVESDLDAAAGQRAGSSGARPFAPALTTCGRAERAGEGELVIGEIDGDDLARAGEPGAEHCAQAHAAEAHDRDRRARRDLAPC